MLAQIRTHIARGPRISMKSEYKDIMTGPRTPEKKVKKLKDPTPTQILQTEVGGGGGDKNKVNVITYLQKFSL